MLAERLRMYLPLQGWTVLTDQSGDIAVQPDQYPVIVITTTSHKFAPALQQWETRPSAMVDFEIVSGAETAGVISRTNHTAVARIIGAIAEDRSFEGKLEDIQEVDVAPTGPNGIDAGSTSLQVAISFITSREDWFIIVGQ